MTVEAKKVTWFLQTEHIVGKVEIADRSPKTHSLYLQQKNYSTWLAPVERGDILNVYIYIRTGLHLLLQILPIELHDYTNFCS
jgi:hypothetical protein